jgi:hypothetical protein
MKRVVIGLMVLTLALFLSSAAFAKAGPTSICLYMDGYGDVLNLTLKAGTAVNAQNGKVKMYLVTGNHSWPGHMGFPVTGTAYVIPGTTTVVASITGTRVDVAEPVTYVERVQWDYAATVDPVGTVDFREIMDAVGGNQHYPLNRVLSTDYDIPF